MKPANINTRSSVLNYSSCVLVLILLSGCVPIPHTTPRTGEVRGRVLDARTRTPVKDAKVFMDPAPHHATYTGADGWFRLKATRNFHLAYIFVVETGHWPEEKYSVIKITHAGYALFYVHWGGDIGDVLLTPAKQGK